MDQQWAFQIRLYLGGGFADAVRGGTDTAEVRALTDILARHHGTLVCTYDSFVEYVREAERAGPEGFALYKWTKATIEDPVKADRHRKSFSVRLDGNEVYPQEAADALEADLQPLVRDDLIERLLKNDTNPANNMPVPAEYR
jgi:hypothetical protein